jgi:prevent-host-death family protein
MQTIGLFEAKQKLSELVERAEAGEQIGITRRGKLTAMIVPARRKTNLRAVFEQLEQVRKRSRKSSRVRIKDLIEEGRA